MSGLPNCRPATAGCLPMGRGDMANVKVGVMTEADVNTPSSSGPTKWADLSAPSTWSTIWFVVFVVFLLKVL